ncbi:hypothetical protein A2803_03845 [Candidatus Woesebacteria bacterium RIFCSPHIGHO2_01_FULL_44_21]|uniref:Polysaccharide biosynthesis protein C-terminal domain-containing protein n=1 Tax=Candidatus Woesebacteria bacterium RIFCSPHIGHO2_01_FULL_44_21 TaxID=1802503 RepID=A0A1F7YX58_9BACT|nr:MAG: hypothetical protein A2803_03845 [Candidatus Woesebacteria bacterium RIFCSPHIGHO2_01_FULL_44_21]
MEKLKEVIKTKTLRQSSITFGGSLVNGTLGAVFFILVARNLGPAAFGVFSLAVAVSTLLGDVADLGVNTGIVRFVGKFAHSDPSKALKFLKLGLEIKVSLGLGVVVLGYVAAPLLATLVFQKPEITQALRLSFVGVGGMLLFTFTSASLQAYQKFWHWSALYVFTNALRLVFLFALISLQSINITNSLVTYISIPFLGFVVGSFFTPVAKFLSLKGEFKVASQFFDYNKWVALSAVISAVSSRLDTFISARLLTEGELGIYSASNQLVQVVPQLIGALGTVIAPKMSAMATNAFPKYLQKTQILVLIIALLGLFGIPVAQVLIPLFYGSEFVGSVPIFIILLLAMLVFLIALPVHLAVYYHYGRPKLFFYIGLGHFAISLVVGWFMISKFGGIGAALTVLIGMIFSFVVPAVWVANKLTRQK